MGRVLWRELEEYKPESEGELDGSEGLTLPMKSVKESFPIVAKHHESMGQLGPLIVRRATAELRSPSVSPTVSPVPPILISRIGTDRGVQ
jgi:hypothetical protein